LPLIELHSALRLVIYLMMSSEIVTKMVFPSCRLKYSLRETKLNIASMCSWFISFTELSC